MWLEKPQLLVVPYPPKGPPWSLKFPKPLRCLVAPLPSPFRGFCRAPCRAVSPGMLFVRQDEHLSCFPRQPRPQSLLPFAVLRKEQQSREMEPQNACRAMVGSGRWGRKGWERGHTHHQLRFAAADGGT